MPKQIQALIILIYILLPETLIQLCQFGQSASLIMRSPGSVVTRHTFHSSLLLWQWHT